jgi:hypothetical protein
MLYLTPTHPRLGPKHVLSLPLRPLTLPSAPLAPLARWGAAPLPSRALRSQNKFRSMLLRVRVGVQLDADQVVLGANCDRLFGGAERETTAKYPYPIMPLHWMSRMKGLDSYGAYASSYPGDIDDPGAPTEAVVLAKSMWQSWAEQAIEDYGGAEKAVERKTEGGVGLNRWPPRVRWGHCHPTWTVHAHPFIADLLLNKLDYHAWSVLGRVRDVLGPAPVQNPITYMNEDEDQMNIMLWRHKANKLWCKWDLEPDLFPAFLDGPTHRLGSSDMYADSRWYVGFRTSRVLNNWNWFQCGETLHFVCEL